MRILLLANEHQGFEQVGFRRPLKDLKNARLIDDFLVKSPQLEIESGVNPADVRQGLVDSIREFRPTVVFIMHPHKMAINQKLISRMRDITDFKLILWEGDAYSLTRKQPSLSDVITARNADVVFTVGKGMLKRNLQLYGARDVRWVPHCFETDRLPNHTNEENLPVIETAKLMIIGNRSNHRFRPAPGWKQREYFVEECQRHFGDELALYGQGWDGQGVRGPIPFHLQYLAIRSAELTANWDHYPKTPWYFSNRLPISLALGSIHATTFHPGYDFIFPKDKTEFLITSRTPAGLVKEISDFLERKSQEEIALLRKEAKCFAYQNFRQDNWIVKMLNFDGEHISPSSSSDCWTIES